MSVICYQKSMFANCTSREKDDLAVHSVRIVTLWHDDCNNLITSVSLSANDPASVKV